MKKILNILIVITFMSFCSGAQEGNTVKTLWQLSDGTSKFKTKCEQLQQLNRLAGIDLKYFKIKNKTGFDIRIYFKNRSKYFILPINIPSSSWRLFGIYNQIEFLNNAEQFEVYAYNYDYDVDYPFHTYEYNGVEDNEVYEINIEVRENFSHKLVVATVE